MACPQDCESALRVSVLVAITASFKSLAQVQGQVLLVRHLSGGYWSVGLQSPAGWLGLGFLQVELPLQKGQVSLCSPTSPDAFDQQKPSTIEPCT
jgi:hypothetical protein